MNASDASVVRDKSSMHWVGSSESAIFMGSVVFLCVRKDS